MKYHRNSLVMLETPHETYSFGEFTLDVSGHLFLRGQDEIKLTGKPFKALVHLVKKPNTLVTKNELIDAVYGGDINLTPDAPKKWIEQIRAALGDEDQMIEIVRGEGWRFKADVKVRPTLARAAHEFVSKGRASTFREWRRGPGKGITLALGAGLSELLRYQSVLLFGAKTMSRERWLPASLSAS